MTRRRTSLRWAIVLCGALGLAACGRAAQQDSALASAAEAPAGEVWTQKSEVGPVQVTVTLAPKRPRLGDPLTLTLTVDAQAGVHVEMPPFGDALGRFSIASFTPRSESTANGGTRHSQRYVLEAPMSGRQRVPSLRIEFADNRPGTDGAGRADGGAEEATHEILTDEIAVDVASVLPAGDGKTDELRGLREPLPESIGATRWLQLAPIPIALLSIVVAYGLVRRMRTRAQQRVRASAYDVAMARLSALRGRGFPGEEDADPFYVDLSDIVRRYIEDRYGLRAPELTTEEFLRESQHGLGLSRPQRERLEAFLSTCDRVKFAGYRPGQTESSQAFGEAQQFVEETRPTGLSSEVAR